MIRDLKRDGVQVGDQAWKRHADQLLQISISQTDTNNSATVDDDLNSWPSMLNDSLPSQKSEQASRHYPSRLRQPSDRYSPSNF